MASHLRRYSVTLLIAAGALMMPMTAAHAIVIAGGGGTSPANDTAPADDPGWSYVGQVGASSGVYLGNGWVLTANHVSGTFSSFTAGATTYNAVSPVATGSTDNADSFRLHAVGDPSTKIDLRVFRVTVPDGSGLDSLSPITLPTQDLSTGDSGTMIGRGRGQLQTTPLTWYIDTDTNPDTWYTSLQPGVTDTTRQGYEIGDDSTRKLRWATNAISSIGPETVSGAGTFEGFRIVFNNLLNEGLAVGHDSGSPFFIKRGGVWELVGIAHGLGTFEGQPANTAVFGDISAYSNLFAYRDQLAFAIPEPGVATALLISGVLLIRRRRTVFEIRSTAQV